MHTSGECPYVWIWSLIGFLRILTDLVVLYLFVNMTPARRRRYRHCLYMNAFFVPWHTARARRTFCSSSVDWLWFDTHASSGGHSVWWVLRRIHRFGADNIFLLGTGAVLPFILNLMFHGPAHAPSKPTSLRPRCLQLNSNIFAYPSRYQEKIDRTAAAKTFKQRR